MQTWRTTPPPPFFFFAPMNNKMYCWLWWYFFIPHRAAVLNTSWQLQKRVSQDCPEPDCADIQLRINLALMSLSFLNSSHCFYSVCVCVALSLLFFFFCLTTPGIILIPIGWAGEIQQNENYFLVYWLLFVCCILVLIPISSSTKTMTLKSPPVFPVFPASLPPTSISRAIKSVIKTCS